MIICSLFNPEKKQRIMVTRFHFNVRPFGDIMKLHDILEGWEYNLGVCRCRYERRWGGKWVYMMVSWGAYIGVDFWLICF